MRDKIALQNDQCDSAIFTFVEFNVTSKIDFMQRGPIIVD